MSKKLTITVDDEVYEACTASSEAADQPVLNDLARPHVMPRESSGLPGDGRRRSRESEASEWRRQPDRRYRMSPDSRRTGRCGGSPLILVGGEIRKTRPAIVVSNEFRTAAQPRPGVPLTTISPSLPVRGVLWVNGEQRRPWRPAEHVSNCACLQRVGSLTEPTSPRSSE